MLAVSRNSYKDEREGEMEGFSMGGGDEFLDFSGDTLLDSIDFDDLFDVDGDVLPDLEMDPEILAGFSVSGGEDSSSEMTTYTCTYTSEDKVSGSGSSLNQGESKRDDHESVVVVSASPKEARDKGTKSSAQSKNHHGKRKVKVDWTPELHRRFVQAVEQLGVDKAVPSRILELMGIDCLTRHNIASHLQKYRSHRKHLIAREAEAASWSQRRQMYSADDSSGGAGGGMKREMTSNSPWLAVAPTMCFPPMAPLTHHFRPLHVWGHPPLDQSLVHIWPKHIAPSPPQPTWPPPLQPHPPPPPPLPPHSSFWHTLHQRVPNSLTQGTPYFPPPMAPTRFPAPPVPGIPPHAMYNVDPGIGVPTTPTCPHPPFDLHPSKESVDEVIGDVLSKPWQPLPIGLNPPSLDSVMVELNSQGIQKIPLTCA